MSAFSDFEKPSRTNHFYFQRDGKLLKATPKALLLRAGKFLSPVKLVGIKPQLFRRMTLRRRQDRHYVIL
jgi:hypothetical protein